MSPQATDLVQGTLEVLILKTLALEPMHGWGIGQRIQHVSKDVLQVGQGSLYPALHRLGAKGWIHSEWGPSENNRRARYSQEGIGRLPVWVQAHAQEGRERPSCVARRG